ncbi:MAG TPA: hypothetical protein DEB40_09250 [Elusimicrobia bacterium]|nr:hypothetical protein [Elusimicrobiota bacterium]HBT61915.1 hypothetical protein [Elusimicrobiota bacterium]
MAWFPSPASWAGGDEAMSSGAAVVMVSASFHPYVGGAEKQALELSAALLRRGVKVRVLTRRLPGLPAREEIRGVPVQRLWCAGSGFLNSLTFMAALGVWLWARRADYVAVHVHLAGSPALPAALAGKLLGKKVFIKLGGGRGIGELAVSARTIGGRIKLGLLSWLGPHFVAVTRELAEECAEYLGSVSVRVEPNGVDVSRYHPVTAEEKLALRRKLGWPEGLCFLYVGRLSAEKQLDFFLRAWLADAPASAQPSFVAIVGQGSQGDKLQALAASSPLAGRVLALPFLANVSEAYAAADVFILPSLSEGLSNSLLEAMASGLGILGSRVGGTAEAVTEEETGLLFAPGDEAGLRAQMQRYLREPELAGRLGAAARQRAVRDYSLERVAGSYEKMYTQGAKG